MADEYIERRIVTGLIISDKFIAAASKKFDVTDLGSAIASKIAFWCSDYFQKYGKAPKQDIQDIFEAEKGSMSESQAELISDILAGLSADFESQQFNEDYLLDEAVKYYSSRKLNALSSSIKTAVSDGDLVAADKAIGDYLAFPGSSGDYAAIDPLTDFDSVLSSFDKNSTPIINYPKALGQFWNHQLTRDSFISLVAPEKRGKTFLLMDMAFTAVADGCNVVFFQAGDMTEAQMLRRIGIYTARRSDKERYCDGRYIPVVDCWYNQTGTCHRQERECTGSLFASNEEQKDMTLEKLRIEVQRASDYKPCRNCRNMRGAVFLKWIDSVLPLTGKDAVKSIDRWRKKHKGRFKLSTYPNDTLTVVEIRNLLQKWERTENFVADVVIIDYADILAPDKTYSKQDYRQQNNKIWQGLRRLSQERHCLVITATQAAATSYTKESLGLKDFSEDKRKYAHVTAMYSLNQTDEEKKLGILRLGEMVVRDDEYDNKRQVKILQCLQRGRPVIGSFF